MAEEDQEEKPAVQPAPYVQVRVVDYPESGYLRGVVTTMQRARAEELQKSKKVEILKEGEGDKRSNKRAPAANEK